MSNDTLEERWNGAIVALSFVMSYMGAYSTVGLAEQYRITGSLKSKFFSQSSYLVMMAISLGGGAIWSMHFVGMNAMEIIDDDGSVITIEYDIIKTFMSLLVCVLFVFIGLYVSSRDKMFARDKSEIVELIKEEGRLDPVEVVQSKMYLIRVSLIRGTGPLIMGGIIAGGGVCAMHYFGMLAMRGNMKTHWNVGIVFASVLIAIVAATAAFWILFRLVALFPSHEYLRFTSAFVAAVAVCGMHYTGMSAATYTLDVHPPPAITGIAVGQDACNTAAIVLGVLISWVSSTIIQSEMRSWHIYLHDRVKDTRNVLETLNQRYSSDELIRSSVKKHKKDIREHEMPRSHIKRYSQVNPFEQESNDEEKVKAVEHKDNDECRITSC